MSQTSTFAREIAKEITLKAMEKIVVPARGSGGGQDYEKYAKEISEFFTTIARAVDEA